MRSLQVLIFVASLISTTPAWARDRGPDCPLVFEVYAHAVAHGKEARFLEVSGDYAECVIDEALRGRRSSGQLLSVLKAQRQLDGGVRRESYRGAVRAHPLIVKAGFLAVRALTPEARGVYISSLVRSPDQQRRLLRHPVFGRWAARRSKHVLGGLAVDVAFVRPRRSMAQMGRAVRRALRRELGEEARLLRVVVERHCLHIELDSKHPVARRAIEQRKQELLQAGILKRSKPGLVPTVNDYLGESEWRSRG